MNTDSSSDSRVTLRARFRTATREAILDAAATLLGGTSASQTRMEDIAAHAGVAVGTVYNYFEDRTALVSALLETRSHTLLSALDVAGELASPVPPGRTVRAGSLSKQPSGARSVTPADIFAGELTRFVAALGAHIDTNRFLFAVLLEEEQQRGIDARSASRRRTVLGEVLARAERLMVRGIRVRALRKDDPAHYAALLVGMVKGLAMSALIRQSEMSAEGTATIVRIFMTGAAR